MSKAPVRLVAFDLDGTLIKGMTAAEGVACAVGQLARMREIEQNWGPRSVFLARREEIAGWFKGYGLQELCSSLHRIALAPGTREALRLLRENRIKTAIVSVTWEFAVGWFAQELGADYHVGTRLAPSGAIDHFWPDDKPRWLAELAGTLGLGMDQVAAVGDSPFDIPMLDSAGHRFYVGPAPPEGVDGIQHIPNGNILSIARAIVGEQRPETESKH